MYSSTILLDLLHRAVEKKGCVLKGLFYILALTLVKALVVPHQTSVWRGLRFLYTKYVNICTSPHIERDSSTYGHIDLVIGDISTFILYRKDKNNA